MSYTIENPAENTRVQAIFIRAHLRMLSVGMKARHPGIRVLAAASELTGKTYKRGQYKAALDDIQELLA